MKIQDHGVHRDLEWSWPIRIVEVCDSDGTSQFWMVWCAYSNSSDGRPPCHCWPFPPVGTGYTKEQAIQSWQFQHLVSDYTVRKMTSDGFRSQRKKRSS